jgi:hypothetical protein
MVELTGGITLRAASSIERSLRLVLLRLPTGAARVFRMSFCLSEF